MAKRYELGMSLDYVAQWGIVDAVREIFQNALDEEIQNPENKWYFNYDKNSQILRIGNKLGRLSANSLLLGQSSKRNDENTIGQHGEGYKVATIVLLRNDCSVKVYNYNEKEIWTGKIIKSRRYQANIGVFDIEKISLWKSVPENSLIFEISNISEEVYNQIKEKNLWLQDDLGECISCEYGRLLLDKRYKGKVYVKGLFVCDKSQLSYGYDLVPNLVSLDRDRGLVDSFNLQYQLGRFFSSIDDVEILNKVKDTWDGELLRYHIDIVSASAVKLCNNVHSEFVRKYGDDAIPVTTTEEFNDLKKRNYNVALVSSNDYTYITRATNYKAVEVPEKEVELSERFETWYSEVKKYIPKRLISEGDRILNLIKRD